MTDESRMEGRAIAPRRLRVFEVFLGVCLSIASLLPVAACIKVVWELASGRLDWPSWAIVPGVVLTTAFAWWCVATSWFLLSGHERKTGGVVSPTALVVFGFAFLVAAVFMVGWAHARGAMRASEMLVIGVGCLGLARARFQRARARSRQPQE